MDKSSGFRSSSIDNVDLYGTSVGNLTKWSSTKDGVYYYIKASKLNGKTFTNLEPISEYLAYVIGKELGVDVVETSYKEIHLEATDGYREQDCLVSYTKDFKETGEKFLPAIALIDTKNFSYENKYYWLTKFQEDVDRMIIFDFLIGNYDRHLNNFGVLVDQKKSSYRFTPLFDNGSSLLSNYSDLDLAELKPSEVDRDLRSKPFDSDFYTQLSYVKKLPRDLNLDIDMNVIKEAVNEFSLDMKRYRRERIINFLERRLHHLKGVFKNAN